jgi:class 3 adenylate cyclase
MERRERKVVTVLFADLVGFTARAEQLDPEDVEAMLRPYHERLRSELERYGGTVEKFIGDAVMAVFGAPVAHEDDPERAVRAALAIRDWATTGRRRTGSSTSVSRSTAARRSWRSTRDRKPARRWWPATSSTPRRVCRRQLR